MLFRMNNTQLISIRNEAKIVTTDGRYKIERLVGGRWSVVMFDLTESRANEFVRYYRDARVSKM